VSVPRIFIISGVRLYRDGIADALSRQGLLVVGVHGGGRDVIAHVSAARPDVVLLEMAMADSLATARDVQQNVPGVAVVALGVGGSDAELLAYAEAGISGLRGG
jgi:DNA-binding NarL/FixJ family response regulator